MSAPYLTDNILFSLLKRSSNSLQHLDLSASSRFLTDFSFDAIGTVLCVEYMYNNIYSSWLEFGSGMGQALLEVLVFVFISISNMLTCTNALIVQILTNFLLKPYCAFIKHAVAQCY